MALLLLVPAASVSAQIPEKFTNLQVFPKDISRAELVLTMRGIAGDLGLRCHNCHVGPDDLTGMDFATDEKPTKKAAREMLKLVQSVNATLEALPPRDEPRGSVGCYTCHRGAQRPPERLDVLLARVAQEKGAEAAIARYHELKKDHPNDGQYNFAPQALGIAASRLAEAKRFDDALALARLNAEQYPDVSLVQAQIGQVLMQKGDRTAAAEQFRKALKLDPKNQAAQRGLKAAEEPPKQ
jgi:tetratricopeptide (TPR) repeat protein